MSPRRLFAISRKEVLQLRRDPRSLLLAFLLPMALILFFGYAISFDVEDIELGVLDQDRTQHSARLIQAFESSGYFQVTRTLEQSHQAEALLNRGIVRAVLVIPPGFTADLLASRSASLQMLLDGSDANTATITQNYANGIVAGFSAHPRLQATVLRPRIAVETRVWYNQTLESTNMIVPGLVVVIMSIIAAMLTALTIAREWERGTMEQLAATPVGRTEVIIGKLLPYIAIGAFDVALAVVAGIVVFDVPLRGNVLLLAGLTLLFLVGALSFGIFISAALKSQVLATQVAMISTYLPALLLSGFMFSIASMPVVLRGVTYAIPARYYIVITRGIFLKDVGIDVLWIEGLSLIVFAAVGLTLAIHMFKKQIA
jgi:ABC-2 type transport system permease protein